MKYKLSAVIPTVQYGNLQPEIELEGEDINELHSKASAHIQRVWDEYGERPLVKKGAGGIEKKTFTGETLFYNDATHTYTSQDGKELLSGSTYAGRQGKPFDKDSVVKAASKAWGVNESELSSLWDINGKISTEYGSAIHTALETYHLYKEMGAIIQAKKELDVNYALPKNPHLRDIVLSFDSQFGTDALTEVLVSDVASGMAGTIDRLEILDQKKKICCIGDYKTNFELDKKKTETYQHQLSFYAKILQNHGWTVEGLNIYHYADEWQVIPLEVLAVTI